MLCYDGSDASAHAIRVAASRLRVTEAVVVSVYSLHVADLLPGVDVEEKAKLQAQEGAVIATEAGFSATWVSLDAATIWKGLVEYAEQHQVEAVVVGTRGTSILSNVLGSVADGVAHHCKQPVLLVHHDRHGDHND